MYAPGVSSELPQPGQRIGRYRVESLLGEGGMGAVFAATNDVTGRAVAIKWMLPSMARSDEAVARFLAEARATARIEHPNVIQVLDMGQDGSAPFLVMERLRGESLGERLARVGRMSSAETLAVMIPACRGIAEAHSEGIIHRDLKPDNIFLCQGKDGSPRPPKVLDFGISKLYEEGDAKKLTQTGSIMGTPLYMSPEQVAARLDPDPAFDVYSIGVVLYECMAGRVPFDADGLFSLLQKIGSGDATPLRVAAPDVPPEVAEVVMRAMHVNRAHRYSSMLELAGELQRVQAHATSTSPMTPTRSGADMSQGTGPLIAPTSMGAPMGAPAHPPTSAHGQHPATAQHAAPLAATHVAAPQAPPDRTGLIVLGMAVGLLVVILIVGIGVAVVVKNMTNAPADTSIVPIGDAPAVQLGPNTGGAPARVEGLEIGLQFGGACTPSFQGRTTVIGSNGTLTISSIEGMGISGMITLGLPATAATSGVAVMSTRGRVDAPDTILHVMTGQTLWMNMAQDPSAVLTSGTPDPIGGQIRVRRFDANAAIADVTFEHVILQNMEDGSLCTIDGMLQTSGPVMGY